MKTFSILGLTALTTLGVFASANAEGIVSGIFNAPLSATGTVAGTRVGINVYLQNDGAQGAAFMNPDVIGYGKDGASHYAYKAGFNGVGDLSAAQLSEAGYIPPAALARYAGGLVVQDSNGDGVLDAATDTIVGGVTLSGPDGATGQSLQSLTSDAGAKLSVPTMEVAEKPGKRWGGSMMMLGFRTGDKAGNYNATVTLLAQPGDINSADGASYTYTIVAK